MKMTAEEILAMYNQDRSRENMQKIADLNGCTMHDIGEFLKAAADTPKKRGPGRPKKPSSEKTKSNKKTDTRNKVEALPEEKRSQKYLIPEIVESLTREKIDEYRRKADFFREKAAEEELKADELQDFLNGGFCDGAKDGIHGEI